jgi:formylglycine-generating enzyme required for sulfatase activity
MIGFGPKRNAEGLRQREPAPTPDELDDIFAPEPVQSSPRGQASHPRAEPETGAAANPSHVRTRLILRRALIRQARAERVSRKPTPAPTAPARSSAKASAPKKRAAPAPAKAAKPDRKPFRKSRGLQLGLAAAVAGVICGTAVAYFANDYFNGGLSAQNIDQAPSQATSGEIEPAAAAVPPDVAEARASTQPAAFSGEDDAPTPEETTGKSYEEPLPVPSALPQDETEAETDEARAADDPPPAAAEATEARTTETEENSAGVEEPAKVAAVDPAAPTEPARDKLVPGSLETFRDCDRCPVMVKLPPADFTMGSAESEEGHQPNEGPQRLVKLSKPFAIGQFEITIGDWDACVKDGGCKLQIKDEGWGRDKHPAINVSWEDINTQFLPWLSKKTGKKYRLPSEAEWEYAARATMSGDSIAPRFSFGDDGNALCAFGNGADATAKEQNGGGMGADCRDGYATTAPAGSFKPNQFGLFDMHGNVWEWVEDCWNESYGNAPADGKAWTEGDCTSRVVRGGSWNSDIPKLRSATRGWNQPSGRNRSIGFRVAREL